MRACGEDSGRCYVVPALHLLASGTLIEPRQIATIVRANPGRADRVGEHRAALGRNAHAAIQRESPEPADILAGLTPSGDTEREPTPPGDGIPELLPANPVTDYQARLPLADHAVDQCGDGRRAAVVRDFEGSVVNEPLVEATRRVVAFLLSGQARQGRGTFRCKPRAR